MGAHLRLCAGLGGSGPAWEHLPRLERAALSGWFRLLAALGLRGPGMTMGRPGCLGITQHRSCDLGLMRRPALAPCLGLCWGSMFFLAVTVPWDCPDQAPVLCWCFNHAGGGRFLGEDARLHHRGPLLSPLETRRLLPSPDTCEHSCLDQCS